VSRPCLQPIEINGLEIKNRIVRPAHGTEYGHGKIVDETIQYHVARAKGQVGLSILEVSSVHPSSWIGTIWSWDPSIVDGYRRLSNAVRPFGMRMFTQLWHGGHIWPNSDGSPSWAPSAVPSPWGAVPIAMTLEQIEIVIAAFVQSAIWSRDGGMDGIELHFGHGYLPSQFLSPIANKRTDQYGGSFENRFRLMSEITERVRRAVGSDYPLGIRISDEHIDGGLSVEDCRRAVSLLCDKKLIDFVDASTGSYYSIQQMLPTMDTPPRTMLPASGPIAKASSVPTMVCGRFQSLDDVDQAIREGVADMVGLVRPMIADENLVVKTLAGKVDEVRPCISCNQGCVAGILSPARRMLCTVNPTVGLESTLSEDLIRPTAHAKRILIVGGGPAGMEAARVAALGGHRVVLAEGLPRLGGSIAIAARAPHARQIGDITLWMEREIYRLGVEVRTGTYVEAGEVLAESADVVILATGSRPRMDGVQVAAPGTPAVGVDASHVRSSHELFELSRGALGSTALVLDDTGHYEAIGAAEYLVSLGLAVTYVTPLNSFAPQMEFPQRSGAALARLRRGCFSLFTRARLVRIAAASCEIAYLDGGGTTTVPADTVVLVSANQPNIELLDELRALPKDSRPRDIRIVGDALAPRDLLVAIREGHTIARAIA
jgi:2,4-dienoyl-CoA reductase-like NADH-dependent reductase (Old Yellow Enzyme family)/thioredoxin reductase